MKLGTAEHKELFCRSFLDTHLDYEPEKLPWPDLSDEDLGKIRGIPFWRQALLTEQGAGVMVNAFAETIDDPLIKEAIALQGFEEDRHGRLINFLVDRYGIEIEKPEIPGVPHNLEGDFIDFGYEECLDSFFAFGMFGVAQKTEYMHEAMFRIFNPILDEEARHIVFFVNWITYLQIQQGRGFPMLRTGHALWHYSKALWKLVSVFGGSAEEDEKSFTATGANSLIDNLTPAMFFSTCLEENAKRMSQFDSRLLQPQLMPTISRIALRCLNLWPQKRLESAVQ